MKPSIVITTALLASALALAVPAHADPVQTAWDDYRLALHDFADNWVELSDVEHAHDRLQEAKHERDVAEAGAREEESSEPLPDPGLGYGRGLTEFSPSSNLSGQVPPVDVRNCSVEEAGFELQPAPIEYRNGSEAYSTYKMPGVRKYTNLQLKRPAETEMILLEVR